MVDIQSPIHYRRDDDGGIVRILLLEEWYDWLKPIYDSIRTLLDVAHIREVPDAAKTAARFFVDLIIQFEVSGWVFGLSILALLHWAAQKAITLGKFTYEKNGKLGNSKLGEFRFGGGWVVREFPVES